MRVMIVDDERHMTEYLKHIIHWEDYGVADLEVLMDGIEAKKRLLLAPPQLLIADICMPEVSGLDLAQFIHEEGLNTKVMIISGFSEFSYAQQAIRYGVTEYLVKPVLKKDFITALSNILKSIPAEIPIPELDNSSTMQEADDEVIFKVKGYVEGHFDEPLSLETLGQIAHLNPSYLSHYFKVATGETLMSYLLKVRMTKAVELLRTSDLKVNVIAEMVGYSKPQYFIALFKKTYGSTPQQFRKQV